MRSFSNIMPNFADNLHLLVDSIQIFYQIRAIGDFFSISLLFCKNFRIFASAINNEREFDENND